MDAMRCDAMRREGGDGRTMRGMDGCVRVRACERVGTRGHSSRPRAGRVEWNASIAGSGRASLYPLRARARSGSEGRTREDARGGGEAGGWIKK